MQSRMYIINLLKKKSWISEIDYTDNLSWLERADNV